MDFIAAVSVAVGGKRMVKIFKNNIQRANGNAVHGKTDIHICVEGFWVFVVHFLRKSFLPER